MNGLREELRPLVAHAGEAPSISDLIESRRRRRIRLATTCTAFVAVAAIVAFVVLLPGNSPRTNVHTGGTPAPPSTASATTAPPPSPAGGVPQLAWGTKSGQALLWPRPGVLEPGVTSPAAAAEQFARVVLGVRNPHATLQPHATATFAFATVTGDRVIRPLTLELAPTGQTDRWGVMAMSPGGTGSTESLSMGGIQHALRPGAPIGPMIWTSIDFQPRPVGTVGEALISDHAGTVAISIPDVTSGQLPINLPKLKAPFTVLLIFRTPHGDLQSIATSLAPPSQVPSTQPTGPVTTSAS
jgi:hypothetical protein